MATKQKAKTLYSPRGIAAYVNLFKPRQRTDAKGNPKGDPKFGLALFFAEGTDLSELEDIAYAKAMEAFATDKPAAQRRAYIDTLITKGKINWPFADTADMEDASPPFDQPGTVLNFKKGAENGAPGIVDADAEPIMDKSEVYSGMEARVTCRCFAYDNESKGISFALINVQKLADGERMSGDDTAENDFKSAPPVGGGRVKPKPGKVNRGRSDGSELL